MAVKPTPNNSLYKGFTFDGIDSRDYGVYISGDAVFDSPERDVEMIEIPGRNGSFALDKGRFSNITVSYPAGLFGDTEADFRQGISALRNALASRKGYCRLEDDYNPDEYRMAVYKKGLEVDPALLKAGEFTIEFDCQPQRFLKSGETEISITSGQTVTNPTLFDASPLLKVYGYGEIVVGNGSITVADGVLVGNVTLSNGGQRSEFSETIVMEPGKFETGNIITLAPTTTSVDIRTTSSITSVTASVASGYSVTASAVKINSVAAKTSIKWPEETFVIGTSKDLSSTVNTTIVTNGGTVVVQTPAIISYNASTRTITRTFQASTVTAGTVSSFRYVTYAGSIEGYSTAPAYTEPLYFDLSIGEAYAIEGGTPVSINGAVSFGVDLPVLPPGANTITYDNTIEGLRIVPRWWEV